MTWREIAGHWPEYKERVRMHWRRLTRDDLAGLGPDRDELVARIAARYGMSRGMADREVTAWAALVKSPEFV